MKQSVVRQVAELAGLGLAELKKRWLDLYGVEAPVYSKVYLVKRLAHRIQELAYGGLSEGTRAELREAAEGGLSPASAKRRRRKASRGMPIIGTRLVREWNSKRYEVTVVSGGFEYEGQRYRSLSAITRAITGTRWNGPSFFGLREKSGKRAS